MLLFLISPLFTSFKILCQTEYSLILLQSGQAIYLFYKLQPKQPGLLLSEGPSFLGSV